MVRKDWASQNSIALSWQEPDFPHGAILDYEIKYYEKVGLTYSITHTQILKSNVFHVFNSIFNSIFKKLCT